MIRNINNAIVLRFVRAEVESAGEAPLSTDDAASRCLDLLHRSLTDPNLFCATQATDGSHAREVDGLKQGGQAPVAVFDADLRDFMVSTVYSHLVGKEQRRRLAAFFTPPWLSSAVLDALEDHSIDWSRARVLDPASGGAAFVVPVARRMMTALRAQGLCDAECLASVHERLRGVEIDPGLALLSAEFVDTLLRHELGLPASLVDGTGEALVRCADFLTLCGGDIPSRGGPCVVGNRSGIEDFDVIVGNPPYGRPAREDMAHLKTQFADIASGALDLYAVFVRKALDHLRPGGLLAFVIPSSFLGGPYFSRFRATILDLATVERIDRVLDRKGVFVDVQHAVCLLVLRKRSVGESTKRVSPQHRMAVGEHSAFRCGVVHSEGRVVGEPAWTPCGGVPWVLPIQDMTKWKASAARKMARNTLPTLRPAAAGAGLQERFGTCLADIGVQVRVGYYVPHRNFPIARGEAGVGRYPLVWECCILQNQGFDPMAPERMGRVAWVEPPEGAGWVHRVPCVVVQRTSRTIMNRRIHAAVISEDFLSKHGGFVAENHVIMLTPAKECKLTPDDILQLITAQEFEGAFQERCGSISVSARLLSTTPIPEALLNQNGLPGYAAVHC